MKLYISIFLYSLLYSLSPIFYVYIYIFFKFIYLHAQIYVYVYFTCVHLYFRFNQMFSVMRIVPLLFMVIENRKILISYNYKFKKIF